MNTDPPLELGFRPAVVATVRNAMLAVVREGTGQRAKLDGVEVGGKTGSAQVVTHARLESNKDARAYQPHGWFMAFAPPANGRPGVAVAVLVEHGVSGGMSAAPVVGKALARYYGVPAIGPGMTPPPDVIPAEPQPERAHALPPPPPRVGDMQAQPPRRSAATPARPKDARAKDERWRIHSDSAKDERRAIHSGGAE
jgi:membrane peptidoglycan carboxypeptidase